MKIYQVNKHLVVGILRNFVGGAIFGVKPKTNDTELYSENHSLFKLQTLAMIVF